MHKLVSKEFNIQDQYWINPSHMVISMINCKMSDSNQCDLHRQHPTSYVPRASGQHKPCTAAKDLHQACSQQSSSPSFASTRAANRLCTLLDTADGLLFLGFTKQSNTGTAPGWTNHTSQLPTLTPFSYLLRLHRLHLWDEDRNSIVCTDEQETSAQRVRRSDNRANVCLSLFINSVCSKLYNYENNKTTAGSPGIFTISPCCSEVSLCCCTDWLCLVPQDVENSDKFEQINNCIYRK